MVWPLVKNIPHTVQYIMKTFITGVPVLLQFLALGANKGYPSYITRHTPFDTCTFTVQYIVTWTCTVRYNIKRAILTVLNEFKPRNFTISLPLSKFSLETFVIWVCVHIWSKLKLLSITYVNFKFQVNIQLCGIVIFTRFTWILHILLASFVI